MVVRGAPAEIAVSTREAEVLGALAEHLTNAEIAAKLFISIRTVESHVSSLLRKLQVSDRRALAGAAATLRGAASGSGRTLVATALPSPLTSFVGRVRERTELVTAVGEHRLVTAVGPGGVGKTRLALAVAADVTDRFEDGVWYVDLVPVVDPAMIAPAIAAALGVGEQQGRSADDTVLMWLARRTSLLVLDNCEHLLGGVGVLLERLLGGSPGLTVLATSRARLLVPFEWVFAVPGLSTDDDSGGPGDAAELFAARAAAGGTVLPAEDTPRVVAVCRALEGMALAIELAAARLPSVGLAGLEAGLGNRLRLLTGGRRVDDRHRSLRSTIDWSYALLDDAGQAVLRRVSVFASPFSAAVANAVVGGWRPVADGDVPTLLAGLADQSLLLAAPGPDGTRYRARETIRQYGTERLLDAAESAEAAGRHLRWSMDVGRRLADTRGEGSAGWRSAFDDVADELRAALSWASGLPEHLQIARQLAILLAELSFVRGLPGEAQRRYEQAAALSADGAAAAAALRMAAGAAEARQFGTDALRLLSEAASVAKRSGDAVGAAGDLARSALLINRAPGIMNAMPPAGTLPALLAEARELAVGDAGAEARVLIAEAFDQPESDPHTETLVERALVLARQVADPLLESAALDQLTAIQLSRGELRAAAASTIRRLELLAPLPMTAAPGIEVSDAFGMAVDCAIACGDLPAARRLAEAVRDLPFHREEGHLATSRLLLVTAFAGDWDETVTLSERFRDGWERAGRPRVGNLSRGVYAVATVHGLRGDDDARAAWLDIVAGLATPGRGIAEIHFGEFFDAWLLLHRGLADEAVLLLATPPEGFRAWHNGSWRSWYAALWAEAAVLTGHPEATERLARAERATAGNSIATALVARAAAIAAGDSGGLRAAADSLAADGCRYQEARTRIILGGDERVRGETALAELGATPMVWPG